MNSQELFIAVCKNNYDLVKQLVAAGADFRKNHHEALRAAIERKYYDIASHLFAQYPDNFTFKWSTKKAFIL